MRFIDCTSAESELMELHNNQDGTHPDLEKFIKDFKRCFRVGAISSNCGRRVIPLEQVFLNLHDITKQYEEDIFVADPLLESNFKKVLDAVFDGIQKHCATYDFNGSYIPKKETK